MKLLVVTPTRGESPWLKETIASVALPRTRHVHVLVAPSDRVASLAEQFPNARVIAEPGGGMYAAINAGIRAASDWDAFTYLNDDDLLLPNFTSVVEIVQRERSSAVVGYGRVKLIDAKGNRLGGIPISPAPTLNRALYAQRIEPVYQHGTIVSRKALDQLGGFDPSLRFCGDSEFLARACLIGLTFRKVAGAPVAAFRLREGQLTKHRAAMIAERTRVDEKLGLIAPRRTLKHLTARFWFRLSNAPVYIERLARHGFATFDEVLERAGRTTDQR